jgi:hypothetical protein
VNAARRLQSDPANAEALARTNELLGKFQAQLAELNGKKLPRCDLDPFGPAMAQISRILSGCPEDEDCCLFTEADLMRLLRQLERTFKEIGCEHLITRLTARAGRRAAARTRPTPVAAPPPLAAQPLYAEEGTRRVPLYLEVLPISGEAASRLADYVPEPLRPPLQAIASRSLEYKRQLRVEEKAGTLAQSLLAPRLGLQLNEDLMVLTAAYAVAQDTAPAAAKASLAEVGRQLNLLTQQLTGARGSQRAAP